MRENLIRGLVAEQYFDEIRVGRKAHDLFEELLDKRPRCTDVVFTHGDYCLPNIVIDSESEALSIGGGLALPTVIKTLHCGLIVSVKKPPPGGEGSMEVFSSSLGGSR